MIEHLFQLGTVGLIYDGLGIVVLGYAFFSKTIKEMMVESGTYYNGNNALLQSLIHTRTDGVTGTVLLLIGFLLQLFGSLGIRCAWLGETLVFILAAISFAYALFLRKKIISIQVSKGIVLRQKETS